MRNANPPRNPPTGFFGLETVPRFGDGVASLRRMEVVERSLGCVLVRWTRLRESERQPIVVAIVVVVCREQRSFVARRWPDKSRVASRDHN